MSRIFSILSFLVVSLNTSYAGPGGQSKVIYGELKSADTVEVVKTPSGCVGKDGTTQDCYGILITNAVTFDKKKNKISADRIFYPKVSTDIQEANRAADYLRNELTDVILPSGFAMLGKANYRPSPVPLSAFTKIESDTDPVFVGGLAMTTYLEYGTGCLRGFKTQNYLLGVIQ